jgi:DNA mismatch repair protein MutS2
LQQAVVFTMISIHQNTLRDLEFDILLGQVSAHCVTNLGKKEVLGIRPFSSKSKLIEELNKVNEYQSSFNVDNNIPNHGFSEISKELKLLSIENTFLEIEGFRKIAALAQTTNSLLKFFKKYKLFYKALYKMAEELEYKAEIVDLIHSKINRFGEIKDDATPLLKQIRTSIKGLNSKINSSFSRALNQYKNYDYLDEIRESVIDNKQVLAVRAMHRRKVKGTILGSSKTGSIVYIVPEETSRYQRELHNLEYDENEEVTSILKALTDALRMYLPLLNVYQIYLTQIDLIYAKAKYAKSINAVLPYLSKEKEMHMRDTYHPLLLLSNKAQGLKTFPQTISLSNDNRIIVISGPNAGGKSITLKTIGLLQLMFQSGFLVPVHEKSTMCLFDRILSDIGDNQSIENHLSTYSYRLKQMNYFLKKCNHSTLFLIDEFGTGSDPELGGALAESFLEVFYERESFGIITTHYTNLKLLASELPYMQNANMLFNANNLQPIYKLVTGQAGSSFTFEVAQKNGIPYSLINKAKKKIERGKVRFDKTIAKLQKERSKLEKTERSLKVNERKKIAETDKLEEINSKIQIKLERYQELYDSNQRLIYLGQKLDTLAERYFNNKRKSDLLNELFKIVQIENSKRKKINPKHKKKEQVKKKAIKKEVEQKIAVIRTEKKKQKKVQTEQKEKLKPILKPGDKVRMENGRAIGTIDKIEKNKAVVNYGTFTTNVSVDALELVEKK